MRELETSLLKSTSQQLEVARIIGEPRDPRKPYSKLVEMVCDTDTAEANEYNYYFDVIQDTDLVYTITSTGALTQVAVTPDTPAALTFVDMASPEFYIKFTDLASSKERVIGRKVQTINRAMNAWENYEILRLTDAAIQSGNMHDLTSGTKHFTYQNLIEMIDGVKDYGDKYVLAAGTLIDKDIILWDWTDNKYSSLKAALADLDVEVVRVNQTVTIDGASTSVLASTKAYLFATDTEAGKPVLFVRKKLSDIELLGGVISDKGEQPERLVFTSPNPVNVGATRYLALGVTGFEEVAVAVTNPYAIARFLRS